MDRFIGLNTINVSSMKKMDTIIKHALNNFYDFINAKMDKKSINLLFKSLEKFGLPMIPIQFVIENDNFGDITQTIKEIKELLDIDSIYSILIKKTYKDSEVTMNLWNTIVEYKNKSFIKNIGVVDFDSELIQYLYNEKHYLPDINQITILTSHYKNDYIMKQIVLKDDEKILNNKRIIEIANQIGLKAIELLIVFFFKNNIDVILDTSDASLIKNAINLKTFNINNDYLEKISSILINNNL